MDFFLKVDKNILKHRTKDFAIAVITMLKNLQPSPVTIPIYNQLIRSATSVAANYRAACRAKSDKDFLYKILIVEEEADESLFWLELLDELAIVDKSTISQLMKEADELVSIFVATGKTMRSNIKNR